jgi:hypothetical protein
MSHRIGGPNVSRNQFHLQNGTFAEAMGFCLFKHPERIFGLKPGSDADDVDT